MSVDLPLDEVTRAAIARIDSRLADHTLSEDEHAELRERRNLCVEGIRKSVIERVTNIEARLDLLEGKKSPNRTPKRPPKKPPTKEAIAAEPMLPPKSPPTIEDLFGGD